MSGPSLSVIFMLSCTMELSILWLESQACKMYRLVLGPAPANSARLTSTKPSFRKWRPDLSSNLIEMRHLHASRRPELGLAVILVGKTKVLLYLTQWFCTSILKTMKQTLKSTRNFIIFKKQKQAKITTKNGLFRNSLIILKEKVCCCFS